MTESWRAIPGFEGRYEVSDEGRIRTLLTLRPRYLMAVKRTTLDRYGYPRTTLSRSDGTRHRVLVHRVVATAFLGPCPAGMQVAHNNGVRTDCRAANLRYATPLENQRDRLLHGTSNVGRKHPCPENVLRGEASPAATLNEAIVRTIRVLAAGGLGTKAIATRLGIGSSSVSHVLHRRTWRHVA